MTRTGSSPFIRAALGLLLLLSLAPAGWAQAAKPTSVAVAIPAWQEELLSTTILLAQQKGFFKEEGLDVRFVTVHNDRGKRSDTAVLKLVGQPKPSVQFASSTVDALLLGGINPATVEPLFFYLYGSTYDTNLVVGKNAGIKSVRDLKGKRIRLGQPATYMALRNILKEANLTLDDVKVVRGVNSYDVLAQIEAGKLDGAITYLPTMPLMIASGKVDVLKKNIFSNYVMPFIAHSFIAVNPQYAKANPKVVAAFSRALHKADNLARQNPQELLFVMNEYGKVLDVPPYKVSDVVAERSRDLFGDFHLTSLSDKLYVKGAGASTVLSNLDRFQDLLIKNRYMTKKVDLGAWKQYAKAAAAHGFAL